MTCETVKLPGGGTAIVCSDRRRRPNCQVSTCQHEHRYLCDFPIAPGQTCDRRLCERHRMPQGVDRDYCPEHARVALVAQRQGRLF